MSEKHAGGSLGRTRSPTGTAECTRTRGTHSWAIQVAVDLAAQHTKSKHMQPRKVSLTSHQCTIKRHSKKSNRSDLQEVVIRSFASKLAVEILDISWTPHSWLKRWLDRATL